MTERFFGTDGIRGVANRKLTCELALAAGRACAEVFENEKSLLIARDTRISGQMLECAFVAGAASMGMNSIIAGVIPTPAAALLTRLKKCGLGVMISASHNGINDNGIKIFSGEGFKLSDETELLIEKAMSGKFENLPIGEGIGTFEYYNEAGQIYIDYIKNSVNADLTGMKIALDCAFGAAYRCAGELFRSMGAEVLEINNECDGSRINVACGSTDMSSLSELVRREKCDMGAAYDGDADRVLFVDENGDRIDGDQIMGLIALNLKRKGRLSGNVVVSTVMSNMGFERTMKSHGIDFVRTAVGDRFVIEQIRRRGASIGGEQSGHIILSDFNTTGDGMLVSAVTAAILKASGEKFSRISSVFKPYPQVLLNVKVSSAKGWDSDPDIAAEIQTQEKKLSDRGRILVRPSGTEPLIRVMVESEMEKETLASAKAIAEIIERKLA